MTLKWIEHEIEKSAKGDNIAKNVYDLAALLIVRDYFLANASPVLQNALPSPAAEPAAYGDAIVDTAPTLAQVERALGTIMVNTEADKKRMQDAMTWAKILKGEE